MGQADRTEQLEVPFPPSSQEAAGPATAGPATLASPQVIAESLPFIGQWNQLISTTNWEKGKVINEWRAGMKAGGFASAASSDEVWSQIVGGVTPQHVGRLRRTWERFGDDYRTYEGVYWSHFYAALEWNDAELWLEGAVQNRWSVSQMRAQRWEALGRPADQEPVAGEIVSAEIDEEAAALGPRELDPELASRGERDPNFQSEPRDEGADFGDSSESARVATAAEWVGAESLESLPPARLFESFRDLPEDIAEATSAFKLAIVRHKSSGWKEIGQAEVLRLLDALKLFAQIRSSEPASGPTGRDVDQDRESR